MRFTSLLLCVWVLSAVIVLGQVQSLPVTQPQFSVPSMPAQFQSVSSFGSAAPAAVATVPLAQPTLTLTQPAGMSLEQWEQIQREQLAALQPTQLNLLTQQSLSQPQLQQLLTQPQQILQISELQPQVQSVSVTVPAAGLPQFTTQQVAAAPAGIAPLSPSPLSVSPVGAVPLVSPIGAAATPLAQPTLFNPVTQPIGAAAAAVPVVAPLRSPAPAAPVAAAPGLLHNLVSLFRSPSVFESATPIPAATPGPKGPFGPGGPFGPFGPFGPGGIKK